MDPRYRILAEGIAGVPFEWPEDEPLAVELTPWETTRLPDLEQEPHKGTA